MEKKVCLPFTFDNRCYVVSSLKKEISDIEIEVGFSLSHGLCFTIMCIGDRDFISSDIISIIPQNWFYRVYVDYVYEFNKYLPFLFCYQK